MIKFCKTNLVVQIIIMIQVWKVISLNFGFPPVLANTWFDVSFWMIVTIMVIAIICILPLLTMSYTEGKSSVSNMGTEPLSKVLWVYPYLVYTAVFIQYGEFIVALSTGLCWAVFALLCATHDKVLRTELAEAARRGNVK